jgi:hypothetical protein
MNHAERWKRESQHHEDLIRDASNKVMAAEALLEVRVIAARKVGVTWTTIGRACGIARQSATERFEKLPELEKTLT